MLPRIRDNRDRFLVVLRQNSYYVGSSTRVEFDPFPDSKIKHGAVRPHLAEESESSDYLVVQRNQFFFGEGINIEVIHGGLFPRQRAQFCISGTLLAIRDSSTGLD
jgi:hypothetical protein